jgi:hypothetical protein
MALERQEALLGTTTPKIANNGPSRRGTAEIARALECPAKLDAVYKLYNGDCAYGNQTIHCNDHRIVPGNAYQPKERPLFSDNRAASLRRRPVINDPYPACCPACSVGSRSAG